MICLHDAHEKKAFYLFQIRFVWCYSFRKASYPADPEGHSVLLSRSWWYNFQFILLHGLYIRSLAVRVSRYFFCLVKGQTM
jgi:hypothetical protein